MQQQFPEPTVGALIFSPDGKLFLMKSHKFRDHYVVPGGHIELGESLEQALVREAKEETGLDIYDPQFLCFQEFIYDPVFWQPAHFIFFDFACKSDRTDAVLNEEAQSYVWVSLEEALKLPIEHYTRVAIEAYQRKEQAHGA